jgi:photosystem II stability/assembly factor-like uncharacterized protein
VLTASAWGVWAGTDDGLYFSSRPTARWLRAPTVIDGLEAHPRVLAVVVLDGETVLAGTSEGLLKTRDGGRTWIRRRLGTASEVTALAVSPSAPESVVAATALATFASRDGGESWGALGPAPGGLRIERMAFVGAGAHEVLLAATTGGLLASDDGGSSWSARDDGLPRRAISSLALHPDGRRVFATAARDERVFVSADSGKSWRGIHLEELGPGRLRPLAVDTSEPQRLLVAATPTGFFAVELDVLAAAAELTPALATPPTPAPAGRQKR